MNELQIFNYRDTPLRTVEKDGELWWVLKDVCKVLGIVDHKWVAKRLDGDERGWAKSSPSGPDMIIVNEPGLYKVILRSDKPDAKDLMRWLTHEVLPSIRRTGGVLCARHVSRPTHRRPSPAPGGHGEAHGRGAGPDPRPGGEGRYRYESVQPPRRGPLAGGHGQGRQGAERGYGLEPPEASGGSCSPSWSRRSTATLI